MEQKIIDFSKQARDAGYTWQELSRVLDINESTLKYYVGYKKKPNTSLKDSQIYKDYLRGPKSLSDYLTEEELIECEKGVPSIFMGKSKLIFYTKMLPIWGKLPSDEFPEYAELFTKASKYLEDPKP